MNAMNLFLLCGVAVVAVTRGRDGSFVSCNDADRFKRSKMLPASWVDCTAKAEAAELSQSTIINTNGAGDAFTAGLLVACMLRHTGMTVPEESLEKETLENTSSKVGYTTPQKVKKSEKKSTPYSLYMRENYITLKQKCKGDKKAIFSTCHDMWENLSVEEKALYTRKADEENEEDELHSIEKSLRVPDGMEALDSADKNAGSPSPFRDTMPRNLYMTNRSLNLESAATLASLIAAHHVDTSTRNLHHVDLSRLVERAMIVPVGLEEI
jgi:hypothetical protein